MSLMTKRTESSVSRRKSSARSPILYSGLRDLKIEPLLRSSKKGSERADNQAASVLGIRLSDYVSKRLEMLDVAQSGGRRASAKLTKLGHSDAAPLARGHVKLQDHVPARIIEADPVEVGRPPTPADQHRPSLGKPALGQVSRVWRHRQQSVLDRLARQPHDDVDQVVSLRYFTINGIDPFRMWGSAFVGKRKVPSASAPSAR